MTGMTARRGLQVLIIGGGIGGLCLAQGLCASGVRVAVYERDASVAARNQGYRLHISPEGEQALRECLPARLIEFIAATANIRRAEGLSAYDEQLRPQWAPTFDDPAGDRPDRIDSVDRVTLRHALLAGLDGVVHFGHRLIRHEIWPGGVVGYFDNGTLAQGDVLVAADGTGSGIRDAYPGIARPTDLGVRTIFGRIPMTPQVQDQLPARLRNRFSYVLGGDGYHLGLMPMVFRTEPQRAAARLWPGLTVSQGENYYMCVFNAHADRLAISDQELFTLTGAQLWALVLDCTSGWHARLRELLRCADRSSSFAVAMRATDPIEAWPGPAVIPLGDAVHTMPPSGGVGANTALRDASGLSRALAAVDRGERELADAVRDYQAAMLRYASASVAMSLRIARWSIPRATR